MHWALLIVMAGVINATINFGYKIQAAKDNIFLISACVMALASVSLFSYHFYAKSSFDFSSLMVGKTPIIIAGMGVGCAAILILMISAFSKGPYSIIDPMLVCVYTLASLLIGLLILRETPSLMSLIGVGLYMTAAILMSQAQSK